MTPPALHRHDPETPRVAPRAPTARAAVLLIGAAVLLLFVEGRGVRFSWSRCCSASPTCWRARAGAGRPGGGPRRGAAAPPGGRPRPAAPGPLWAPGWVLAVVGLTEALWFRAGRPADSFELAQLTLLAAGSGAPPAVATTSIGVRVSAMSLAMAVLLTGAFNLAEAKTVPHVADNTWLYAALLAARGLYELAVVRRTTASPVAAGCLAARVAPDKARRRLGPTIGSPSPSKESAR